MLELTLPEWALALSREKPVPAGGALAFVTLSGAAALAAKLCAVCGGEGQGFQALASRFLLYAEEDCDGYLSGPAGFDGELKRLRVAVDFTLSLQDTSFTVPPRLVPDLSAVRGLALASSRVLVENSLANFSALALSGPGYQELCAHYESLLIQPDTLKV